MIDTDEWKEAYPHLYAGFDPREWALDGGNRHPQVTFGVNAPDVFWWDESQLPAEVHRELPERTWPSWSAAMAALVRAARDAYAKGWRP